MTPAPSTARSLLTSEATFCSAAAGALLRPQHVDDPVHWDQSRPLHREQLEQRPGLAAAYLALGQLGPVADDAEGARETQLDTRGNGWSRENVPPHTHFLRWSVRSGKTALLPEARPGGPAADRAVHHLRAAARAAAARAAGRLAVIGVGC